MKKILSLVLSLTVISAVCAGVLAYVNGLTKGPIEKIQAEKIVYAARDVLPAETKGVAVAKFHGDEEYYVGTNATGEVVGYAVKGADPNGYGGDVVLMVGLAADKSTVIRYKTLEAKETPGLGMKLNTPEFSSQFQGKNAFGLKVRKDGGEVDAITSATITSRAVCGAIAAAAAKLK